MKDNGYAVVIGGANLDIGGRSYAPLVSADSNPGRIVTGCGGVGRNIAHTLAKLDCKVFLITALGSDHAGTVIRDHCKKAGIDMTYSLVIPGETSSMYLFINDCDGDMALALSHMDIVKNITPEYIDSVSDVIKGSACVVMDCNLTQDTFLHVKDICVTNGVPVYVDPVSTAHAQKIKGELAGLTAVKPNRLEAELLTGMTISTEADYGAAAMELVRQGVENVFISMGSLGMLAADKNGPCKVDRYPANVVSTTGAGDSATAGIIWALTDGRSLTEAAKAGNAIASMTISVKSTVHPELTAEKILSMIGSD